MKGDKAIFGVIAFLVFVFAITFTVGYHFKQQSASKIECESENVICYKERYCPFCGEKAIATTDCIVCINNECSEYGFPVRYGEYA